MIPRLHHFLLTLSGRKLIAFNAAAFITLMLILVGGRSVLTACDRKIQAAENERAAHNLVLQQTVQDSELIRRLRGNPSLDSADEVASLQALIQPVDRTATRALIERQAHFYHLDNVGVEMGSAKPAAQADLEQSTIIITADAGDDRAFYGFIDALPRRMAGRTQLIALTLTRDTPPDPAPHKDEEFMVAGDRPLLHARITLDWLANRAAPATKGKQQW